jgi:glyoxylate utilization-related uncharacterized protein
MKTRKLTNLVRFEEDAPHTDVLVETEQLWSQVICLQGTQDVGPLVDPRSDGIMLIMAGEVAAQVGKARARMKQWETVTVPAGEQLSLRNASPEPSVVLLVLAPPPA